MAAASFRSVEEAPDYRIRSQRDTCDVTCQVRCPTKRPEGAQRQHSKRTHLSDLVAGVATPLVKPSLLTAGAGGDPADGGYLRCVGVSLILDHFMNEILYSGPFFEGHIMAGGDGQCLASTWPWSIPGCCGLLLGFTVVCVRHKPKSSTERKPKTEEKAASTILHPCSNRA